MLTLSSSAHLFSERGAHREPDWREYASLFTICFATDCGQIWIIHARRLDGAPEWVTRGHSRDEADALLRVLMRRSGLPDENGDPTALAAHGRRAALEEAAAFAGVLGLSVAAFLAVVAFWPARAMAADALAPMQFSTLDLIAGWGAALICAAWFCWEIFNWLFPRRRDDARSDGDAR